MAPHIDNNSNNNSNNNNNNNSNNNSNNNNVRAVQGRGRRPIDRRIDCRWQESIRHLFLFSLSFSRKKNIHVIYLSIEQQQKKNGGNYIKQDNENPVRTCLSKKKQKLLKKKGSKATTDRFHRFNLNPKPSKNSVDILFQWATSTRFDQNEN